MATASYAEARANLAALLDRAGIDHEVITITRRNRPDVALISADELRRLEETAHLTRSAANVRRLIESLERSLADDVVHQGVADLARELRLTEAFPDEAQ